MNAITPTSVISVERPDAAPLNLSRRGFVGGVGALVLGVSLPGRTARAQGAAAIVPGTRVSAFLEVRTDSTILFRSPFIEGGQGIFTAMAQIVGEEIDVEPSKFVIEGAPPGPDYLLTGGGRFTGGSMSVRTSYEIMRKLGASARQMLLQAAATRLDVPVSSLSTQPGRVVHTASGRVVTYGEIAEAAARLPVPADVTLRRPADFRWIGKPVPRLDVRDKSTGKIRYAIDLKVDGMLHAAVQHAGRLGLEPDVFANEAEVRAMPGVHSLHRLPGAVAVLATSWWRARRAVETLQLSWTASSPGSVRVMPADFSSEAHMAKLKATQGQGVAFETVGDAARAFGSARTVVEATYDAPYLAHAQLEPPSALARWNEDSTLELWMPNQAPEMFQADAAKVAGIAPEKVIIHSPVLGGFFGRHFLYQTANPYPQAIALAKAVGRPVKLVWSREEEFLRDALRPMSAARFRAGLDANGLPIALQAVTVTEGPTGRWFGRQPDKVDSSTVEGIAGKVYAIPNRRVGQIHVDDPAILGFWRSVGHSMNDFFYETFFDEMADVGRHDPYELRLRLLAGSPRHKALLEAVADLAGAGSAGPSSRQTVAGVRGAWPWPRPSAARWRRSPRSRCAMVRSSSTMSGSRSIPAASSIPRLSNPRSTPLSRSGCRRPCSRRWSTSRACRGPATMTATPSCRRTRCRRFMSGSSRAARRWAASASPDCPACLLPSRMLCRSSRASAFAACRSPRST